MISPITEPTPWCAGMVAIPNENKRLLEFVKPLSENIMWEVHSLLKWPLLLLLSCQMLEYSAN